MKVVPLHEQGDGIKRNLVDLTSYFLDNGDFNSLSRICSILLDKDGKAGEHKFIDPGFIQKVLDAASSWDGRVTRGSGRLSSRSAALLSPPDRPVGERG